MALVGAACGADDLAGGNGATADQDPVPTVGTTTASWAVPGYAMASLARPVAVELLDAAGHRLPCT
jgi:hypothetical protein